MEYSLSAVTEPEYACGMSDFRFAASWGAWE